MQVAVIGAGTMGHGIALMFALGGHQVRLTDNSAAALERAGTLMETALATLQEAGEAGAEWSSGKLAQSVRRISTLAETVDGADLVIEAIIEQPEPKRVLFAELDRLLGDNVILTSNTSYLDIFPLMPERRHPRALITHWYAPPYLIDLVDVVGNPRTEPAVIETVRAAIAALGQVPIVMQRFIPGYVANRIQNAIILEANRLLDEGYATAADIDAAVIHGLALRMPLLGIFAKADFSGVALTRDAVLNSPYEPPPAGKPSPTTEKLIAEGRTGVLAGRGYFDWGDRPAAELFRERDRKLLALKRALRTIGRMEGK